VTTRLRLQVRALWTLVQARALLARATTTETLRRLEASAATPAELNAWAAAAAVRRAAKVVGGDCLPQSVALTTLLNRSGADPVLILGCRRTGEDGWSAHAWVEVAQTALDPNVSGYMKLATLSANTRWMPASTGAAEQGSEEL